MKKLHTYKAFAFLFFLVFLISCDKDYNTIGDNIVGEKPFDISGEEFDAKAYNYKLDKVQTNFLDSYNLGVSIDKNNVVTRANVVAQLTLAKLNPVINTNVEVDSVVLTIPYFSTQTGSFGDKRYTYDLNEISTSNSPDNSYPVIDLQIYRNGYHIEDYDENNLSQFKKYYSDDSNFESSKIGTTSTGTIGDYRLNNYMASIFPTSNEPSQYYQNKEFKPIKAAYYRRKITYESNDSNVSSYTVDSSINNKESEGPVLRLLLDNDTFKGILKEMSLPQFANNFASNAAFTKYFKGLYFKVNNISNSSSTMMKLDFSKGNLNVFYNHDKAKGIEGNPSTDREERKVLRMNFSKVINTYTNDSYSVDTSNATTGAQKLTLRGGQGCMSLIDIFTNTAQFDQLKAKKLIINNATLTFTVDKTATSNAPYRLYLYDTENNRPIVDYYVDGTSNASNPKGNKFIYGGILYEQNGEKKYTFSITELIKNIYNQARNEPSTTLASLTQKVRLGLVITSNISNISMAEVKNINSPTIYSNNTYPFENNPIVDSFFFQYVGSGSSLTEAQKSRITISKSPRGSVANTENVVLYGSDIPANSADYDKRIKLKINYTEIK